MSLTRSFYLFLVLLITIVSCNDPASPVEPEKPQPQALIDDIPFHISAISSDEFKISISNEDRYYVDGEVILFNDQDSLATTDLELEDDELQANLNASFDENPYRLKVNLHRSGIDTNYYYTIENYNHQFKNKVKSESLFRYDADSYQRELRSYDISPDDQYIFWSEVRQEDGEFEFRLNRYSRQAASNTVIDENFGCYNLVRVYSNSQLITCAQSLQGYTFEQDSSALIRYDVNDQSREFIDYISSNYGRFSRIINDRIIAVRPYLSEPNTYVINLQDESHVGLNIDYRYLDEQDRDVFLVGNYRYDTAREELEPLNTRLDRYDYINDYDTESQIMTSVRSTNVEDPKNVKVRLQVYRGDQLIYKGATFESKSIYWSFYHAEDNSVYFYQDYGYDTEPHTNGIYRLDINAGEVSLIDNAATTPRIVGVMQLSNGNIIGRGNGSMHELQF